MFHLVNTRLARLHSAAIQELLDPRSQDLTRPTSNVLLMLWNLQEGFRFGLEHRRVKEGEVAHICFGQWVWAVMVC